MTQEEIKAEIARLGIEEWELRGWYCDENGEWSC